MNFVADEEKRYKNECFDKKIAPKKIQLLIRMNRTKEEGEEEKTNYIYLKIIRHANFHFEVL